MRDLTAELLAATAADDLHPKQITRDPHECFNKSGVTPALLADPGEAVEVARCDLRMQPHQAEPEDHPASLFRAATDRRGVLPGDGCEPSPGHGSPLYLPVNLGGAQ